MKYINESRRRSIAKAGGYRITLIISNGIVVFLLTNRIDLTLGISILTAILNTLIYYFYERAWNGIKWGRK